MTEKASIIARKEDHVNLALETLKESLEKPSYWDEVDLVHDALSEETFEKLQLHAQFDSIRTNYPLVCVGMTGGYPRAKLINENIARIAEKFQIPMGVGSQRVMLEHSDQTATFEVIRDYQIPVRIANIGMTHLGSNRINHNDIYHLMETIDANFIGIHLNVLQELCQKEGHLDIHEGIEKLHRLSRDLPVLVKETGAGISSEVAKQLQERTDIRVLDTSGLGGTNFALIENRRVSDQDAVYWSERWGIPSPISVMESRTTFHRTIIGSGGIRNGVDAAKALSLGADFAGIAGHLLDAASQSYEAVETFIERTIKDLQRIMILTNSRYPRDLQRVRKIFHGSLRDWL